MEVLDRDAKVVRQVRALNTDLLKPKYYVTYVLVSNEPKTVRVRYACGGDEIGEHELTISRVLRFVVGLLR